MAPPRISQKLHEYGDEESHWIDAARASRHGPLPHRDLARQGLPVLLRCTASDTSSAYVNPYTTWGQAVHPMGGSMVVTAGNPMGQEGEADGR